MSNDKTGGSAFPMADAPFAYQDGMTLRDYFAGQWICGKLDCSGIQGQLRVRRRAARMAYRFADAMIAEREKGGE